jgi:hypothetical protein
MRRRGCRHEGNARLRASGRLCDDAAAEAVPGSNGAVVAAMKTIKPQIGACFDRFRQPGTYEINVTAAGDGTVQAAKIGGHGGLETAECIAAVARQQLHMPPSADGAPYSLVYPFILR